tara:strand:+ start:3635 stop:3901 length:267 start_codon:yes stop_codon:yes gene_type:complete
MKFYRVRKLSTQDSCHGYEWLTNEKDAVASKRAWEAKSHPVGYRDFGFGPERIHANLYEAEIEVVSIKANKAGILQALKSYASHPNNG